MARVLVSSGNRKPPPERCSTRRSVPATVGGTTAGQISVQVSLRLRPVIPSIDDAAGRAVSVAEPSCLPYTPQQSQSPPQQRSGSTFQPPTTPPPHQQQPPRQPQSLQPMCPAAPESQQELQPARDPVMLYADEPGRCSYRSACFKFAHTFRPAATNADVFAQHKSHVCGVLRGYDCTLMVYGQTGSGKTHTMFGTRAEPGLVPLSVDELFMQIGRKADGTAFSLQLSVLEILEERCVDLLHGRRPVLLRVAGRPGTAAAAGSGSSAGGCSSSTSSGGGGGLHFHGLGQVQVRSKEELLQHLQRAMGARTVSANYRHQNSSRAHTVVRLRVEGARLVTLGTGVSSSSTTTSAAAAGASRGGDAGMGNGVVGADGGARRSVGARNGPSRVKSADSVESADAVGDGSCLLSDATSATLTFVDLAGSEAATQNASASTVAQGVAVNKSLHWLKVAVHDLVARKPVVHFRNSALTRLLQPSLAGQAVVALLVTSSEQPAGGSATRDTLEALQFGEAAGRLTLAPKRRTEATAGGQFGKLQSLLLQMADDKATLASDAEALREQLQSYESLIHEYRRDFVSAESLQAAEEKAAAELATAVSRSEELQSRLAEEQLKREELAAQLAGAEAEASAAAVANAKLDAQLSDVTEGRQMLEARLVEVRHLLQQSNAEAAAREDALRQQQAAETELRTQVEGLEARLMQEQAAAVQMQQEAARLAESNTALQSLAEHAAEQLKRLQDEKAGLEAVAQAKSQLLLLRHKMYRSRLQATRPSSAAAQSERRSQSTESPEYTSGNCEVDPLRCAST